MIPLIYHYVFLLKMTQLTISTWRIIEGDLLHCKKKKKLSSNASEKGLGSGDPKQSFSLSLCLLLTPWEEQHVQPQRNRGPWLGVCPQNLPAELQKSLWAEKWGQGAQWPLSCFVQGEVLEWGSIRNENSPHDVKSLPKASACIGSWPAYSHLSSSVSCLTPDLDQRMHSFHQILKGTCNRKIKGPAPWPSG